jgi:hypothetical protein
MVIDVIRIRDLGEISDKSTWVCIRIRRVYHALMQFNHARSIELLNWTWVSLVSGAGQVKADDLIKRFRASSWPPTVISKSACMLNNAQTHTKPRTIIAESMWIIPPQTNSILTTECHGWTCKVFDASTWTWKPCIMYTYIHIICMAWLYEVIELVVLHRCIHARIYVYNYAYMYTVKHKKEGNVWWPSRRYILINHPAKHMFVFYIALAI